ncbi:uncharacterized protein LOC132558829 [Ylistrum balloti]|uniref:uncharacterized protein LOC132558829 n=1 Tax=Ylistrum balloti TaxID=509963 RepID=UPI002905DC64|nr:uncharacterized protein LOC132558829 [Ylistrum balloti]
MRTRCRYIFLIAIVVLLLLITFSEIYNNVSDVEEFTNSEENRKPDTGNKPNHGSVSNDLSSLPTCEDKSPDCLFYQSRLKICNDIEAVRKMGCYKTCSVCAMKSQEKVELNLAETKNAELPRPIIKLQELVNGTTISTSGNPAFLSADFLHGYLTCKFDGLDKETLFNLIGTHTTTPFKICLKKGTSNTNGTVLQTCLKLLQDKCESSKVRVVKTIRVRMRTTVDLLLQKIPGLKVIHLFRDQRPRLLSAESTPFMLAYTLQKTAKLECSDTYDDIDIQTALKKQHPDQIKTLLYERLAEYPLDIARRIFNFLGLPLTKMSIDKIQSMTSSTNELNCPFCTEKNDSAKTAHAWRTKKSQDFLKIKMIEEACEKVQKALGYVPVNNMVELRNISVSLRVDTAFTADVL